MHAVVFNGCNGRDQETDHIVRPFHALPEKTLLGLPQKILGAVVFVGEAALFFLVATVVVEMGLW